MTGALQSSRWRPSRQFGALSPIAAIGSSDKLSYGDRGHVKRIAGNLVRYFRPNIHPASEIEDGPEKLGGLPFGLPSVRWPKCAECGKSQSLLGQFRHNPQRLDLGRVGRVLFVFQCGHDPGMCSTWEALSGANACFVVEPEELTNCSTPVPDDEPPLDREVRVTHWFEKDDGLPDSLAKAFTNDHDHLHLTEDIHQRVTFSTRIGGQPKWLQRADEVPEGEWRFVLQLDSTYSFIEPPLNKHGWVHPDPENFEGRSHVAQGPNFGSGLGYVFLRDAPGIPDGCFFWQR